MIKADASRLLLLSGGMDSACLAAWKNPALAVTVDYGQRAFGGEVRASKVIADVLGIAHETVRCDLGHLGSGDMSDAPSAEFAPVSEWWPFRNQLLVTVGAMLAIKRGLSEVMIGCVKTDALHVDGTPSFIDALNRISVSQEGAVTVSAPAIELTSAELIQRAQVQESLLRLSFSCHRSEYVCGVCSGCRKAIAVLQELQSIAP